jgi:hypothetical protein
VLPALPVKASSYGDDSTIVEVMPPLPVNSEASELDYPTAVINHIIHVNDLDMFLRSKPCCLIKQMKHNVDHSKRYKYRVCACGCSFRIYLIITLTNNMVSVKETPLPLSHVPTDDRVISRHIRVTKEVLGYIDLLVELCHDSIDIC